MNFKENVRIALFSIRTNLMRSLLTMLGIIIGVASVIAIITVGDGGRDYIVGALRGMGQNMVTVSVDPSAAPTQYISTEDITRLREVEHVRYISPQVFSLGGASTAHTSGIAIGIAGTPDLRNTLSLAVLDGMFFNEQMYQNAEKVCVIPGIGADNIFGKRDIIGSYIQFTPQGGSSVQLRVVGLCEFQLFDSGGMNGNLSTILQSSGMMSGMMSGATMIFLPATTMAQLTGSQGAYDNISIIADDESHLSVIGQTAANLLSIRHKAQGQELYVVQNLASYIDILDSVISILTVFIAGVSAISLLVGGIGVMNIMLVSVTERTREIGIRKALGAKTRAILLQFLTESVMICFVGGLIGLLLGISIAELTAALMHVEILVQGKTVLISIGFSSAIGIFFGIYPAQRAARMQPIDALRRD